MPSRSASTSLAWASRRGHSAYCEAMVQRCMADYDIHGWLRGPGSMTERKRWLAGCPRPCFPAAGRRRAGPDAPADLARGKAMAQKMCLALPRRRRQRRAAAEPQLPEASPGSTGNTCTSRSTTSRPSAGATRPPTAAARAERGGRGQRLRLVRRLQRMSAGEQTPGRPEATRTRPPALRERLRRSAAYRPASPATGLPPRPGGAEGAAPGRAMGGIPGNPVARLPRRQARQQRDHARGRRRPEDSDIQALAGYLGSSAVGRITARGYPPPIHDVGGG